METWHERMPQKIQAISITTMQSRLPLCRVTRIRGRVITWEFLTQVSRPSSNSSRGRLRAQMSSRFSYSRRCLTTFSREERSVTKTPRECPLPSRVKYPWWIKWWMEIRVCSIMSIWISIRTRSTSLRLPILFHQMAETGSLAAPWVPLLLTASKGYRPVKVTRGWNILVQWTVTAALMTSPHPRWKDKSSLLLTPMGNWLQLAQAISKLSRYLWFAASTRESCFLYLR